MEALAYAKDVIASYQMDLRSTEVLMLPDGKSPADVGFCQGHIYTDALPRIDRILRRESRGR